MKFIKIPVHVFRYPQIEKTWEVMNYVPMLCARLSAIFRNPMVVGFVPGSAIPNKDIVTPKPFLK
jgi:hypothetical protein